MQPPITPIRMPQLQLSGACVRDEDRVKGSPQRGTTRGRAFWIFQKFTMSSMWASHSYEQYPLLLQKELDVGLGTDLERQVTKNRDIHVSEGNIKMRGSVGVTGLSSVEIQAR